MVNRKGYIKTIEAIIAVVIILIVSVTAVVRNVEPDPSVPSIVSAAQNIITQELAINQQVREGVITCDLDNYDSGCDGKLVVADVIEDSIPAGYTFAYRICDDPSCICDESASPNPCIVIESELVYPSSGEVFMSDTFISSNVPSERNKIVRYWMWRP